MTDPLWVALVAAGAAIISPLLIFAGTRWFLPRFKIRQEVAAAAAGETSAEATQVDFYFKQIDRLQANVTTLQSQVDSLRENVIALKAQVTTLADANQRLTAGAAQAADLQAENTRLQRTVTHLSMLLAKQGNGNGPPPPDAPG